MESPVFFIDRSLGRSLLATRLRVAGLDVRVHDEHFPPEAFDETWLEAVAANGWCVLTTDLRLRYEPLPRAAIVRGRLAVFEFSKGDRTAEEQARAFLRRSARILDLCRNGRRPFVARISQHGVTVTNLR